jgi:hypothetical protein
VIVRRCLLKVIRNCNRHGVLLLVGGPHSPWEQVCSENLPRYCTFSTGNGVHSNPPDHPSELYPNIREVRLATLWLRVVLAKLKPQLLDLFRHFLLDPLNVVAVVP